jgi:hypothetical protein
VVWFGASIAKTDESTGGAAQQRLADFNARARLFAMEHDQVFIDIGDIESHCWDGTLTTNAQGHPIQCSDWGREAVGGHLTYGAAKVRMAKLWIVALARLAGWRPGNQDGTPPMVTTSCTLSGCSATTHDDRGVTQVRATITARDAAGNETTRTVIVP